MRNDVSSDDKRWFTHKIANCIVMHRGQPVYVERSNEGDRWLVTRCSDKRTFLARRSSLDISPIPVGYLQLNRIAPYVSRIPRRTWKFGLSTDNCAFGGYPMKAVIFTENFVDMVLGKYPSYKEVLNKKEEGTYAFSRNWAVRLTSATAHLYYRGKQVGFADEEPVLSSAYRFLREDLEESL